MKKILFSVLLICMVLSFTVFGASAATVTVDFDDVVSGDYGIEVPDYPGANYLIDPDQSYAGFSWGANAEVVSEDFPLSQYYVGSVSSSAWAFANTNGTTPVTVTRTEAFNPLSAWFTPGSNQPGEVGGVTVEGFLAGMSMGVVDIVFSANEEGHYVYFGEIDWIDELVFSPVPGSSFFQGSFAMDDFEYESAPVPIPSAILLFGSGLMGLVGIRRKYMMR